MSILPPRVNLKDYYDGQIEILEQLIVAIKLFKEDNTEIYDYMLKKLEDIKKERRIRCF